MPLFLRSPSTASRVFGLNNSNQLMRSVPRFRFLFFAEFTLTNAANNMLRQNPVNTYTSDYGIAFKVKQVDKPKFTLITEVLNQYNKKKVVYKKVEYDQATVRLHDTVDNSGLSFWVDYFTYFFGDSRPKQSLDYNQSPVNGQFLDSTGWGLRPLTNETNFFSKITIYSFYARTYTSFSYINPKISSIDWGTRDYSANDTEEVIINFQYEAVEYNEFGQRFTREQAERWGWSDLDQLDVASPFPIGPSTAQPRIFVNEGTPVFPGDIEIAVPQNDAPTNTETIVVNQAAQVDAVDTINPSQIRPPESTFGGVIPQFGEDNLGEYIQYESAPLNASQQNTASAADKIIKENNIADQATTFEFPGALTENTNQANIIDQATNFEFPGQ